MFMFIHFRALKDAERAITLAKTWAKGYFRQGRALAGLKVSIQIGFYSPVYGTIYRVRGLQSVSILCE